jgi:glycine cleavage system H protein
MKNIDELELPPDLLYSEDHEWVRVEGDTARVGITDYAQDQLGDITYVEIPEVGDNLEAGEEFGTVESTKAVSEMLMPVGGEILAVNTALEESPDLVNTDAYGAGWMLEVKMGDPDELEILMSRDKYIEMLRGLD